MGAWSGPVYEGAGLCPPEAYPLPAATVRRILIALALVPVLHLLLLALAAVFAGAAVGTGVYLYRMATAERLLRYQLWLICPALGALSVSLVLVRGFFFSFWSPRSFVPAIWINPAREHEFTTLIAQICREMGTDFPNTMLLHLGPDLFVAHGRFTVLNANPHGRTLCVGLPLLACLNVNELRALLYHEFAHFTGRDVLYGKSVRPVYAGIVHTILCLGADRPQENQFTQSLLLLPRQVTVFVLTLYLRLFNRLDMSIWRARDQRADTLAAHFGGTRSLTSALRKWAGYGPCFGELLPSLLDEIRTSRTPQESCYRLFRKRIKECAASAQAHLDHALLESQHAHSGLPTLTARLTYLPHAPERFDDPRPALSLLKDYRTYERLAGGFMANEYGILAREAGRATRLGVEL